MNTFTQYENQAQFKQVACIVITHPKRTGHAVINVAYPRDGAGRLTVYVLDSFGDAGRTCTKGTASGFGYDKLTSALNRLTIDGHALTDHCAQNATSIKLLKSMGKATTDEQRANIRTKARKAGYSFANGNSSCYRESGLEFLRALGYRIINAL